MRLYINKVTLMNAYECTSLLITGFSFVNSLQNQADLYCIKSTYVNGVFNLEISSQWN